MKYGLIGPGRHGSRYLLPENGGNEIGLVLRREAKPLSGLGVLGATGALGVTTDLDYFLGEVDAAIIATPPDSHRDLALACIAARIPILIEKPLALTPRACEEILDAAEDFGVPLLVAHTHLFHPAFEKIILANETVDTPTTRITAMAGGPGPVRDYSALLDWAPHDVAMACAAMFQTPARSEVKELSEGTYEVTLEFLSGTASIVVSNRFPRKTRSFEVEHTWDDGTKTVHTYRGDEPTDLTPMARMVGVFRAIVEEQLEDYRAAPHFTRSVYRALMAVSEPETEREQRHHGKRKPKPVLQG